MKTKSATAAAILLAVLTPGFAASVIDFDDLPDPGATFIYAPSNHYAGIGAVFSGDIPYVNVSGAGWPGTFWPSRGGTPPNFLTLYDTSIGGPGLAIEMRFVVPGTSIPATTDSIRAQFGDSEVGSTTGWLEVFDTNGTLLASRTITTPPEQTFVFEIRTPGIARVRMSVDFDGGVVDNIVFNTPTSSVGTNVTLAPILAICPAVEVTWDSQFGKLYQVQWSSTLDTNWHNLGNPIVGADSSTSICDRTGGRDRRFYRVVVFQ